MQENHYEVEIKALLQSQENAKALLERMKQNDPALVSKGSHKQLNHYFQSGDLARLYERVSPFLTEEQQKRFNDIKERAKTFSVRTRWADGKVILVIKASVDDTTSSNGTARIEFETELGLSLEELDKLILDSGFKYQAKWSRERTDYTYKNTSVSIDKNAGYGYLAEFESIESDASLLDAAKERLRKMMSELEVDELSQDRLERMFSYYNENWPDYYGTDKIFNIE
jgi:predicted adenylyl cyclase CyaB